MIINDLTAGLLLTVPIIIGIKVLEPCAGKLACTVLRGRKLPGWARQKKTRTMREILLANRKLKGNATAQIAHLVFDNTQANPEKPKELFFANARTKTSIFTN